MSFNKSYKTASEAFDDLYHAIHLQGKKFGDTYTIFNCGFYIENPLSNSIDVPFRKWNKGYAEYEWQWYLSANNNATEIAKRAPIWLNHMDENGNVMSNYGWQWVRGSQLDKVIDKLYFSIVNEQDIRQAVISIYDGKEISEYAHDTPCTLSIHFQIIDNKLCMTVNMRSNDLWFGFCNDQYCFSKLQEMVANVLGIEVGWYYHFASNMHLYLDKMEMHLR
jgi:thymidylate synthase